MRFAFPSNIRILSSKDFERAFSKQSQCNKWFCLYSIENKAFKPRLGMVVSKRILPKSVSRNYVKRIIRETFRQNYINLAGMDFVVKLRRKLDRKSSFEAKQALLQLLLNSSRSCSN